MLLDFAILHSLFLSSWSHFQVAWFGQVIISSLGHSRKPYSLGQQQLKSAFSPILLESFDCIRYSSITLLYEYLHYFRYSILIQRVNVLSQGLFASSYLVLPILKAWPLLFSRINHHLYGIGLGQTLAGQPYIEVCAIKISEAAHIAVLKCDPVYR